MGSPRLTEGARSPELFLEELVAINSVSGEERRAAEYTVAAMNALGYREAYVDSAGSAVGRWGVPGGAPVMLVGHIDTVRGSIPVRCEEVATSPAPFISGTDTILHGRGAVDAKGPLATFIQAVAALDSRIPLDITVVGAVEEEAASSKGARQLLEDFPEPRFVIIGEPSRTNGITLGYKGRLVGEITLARPMTHGAHRHESVTEIAFRVHEQVRTYVARVNEGKEGAFPPLDYTVQGLNTEHDGITERGKMSLGFRLGPAFDPFRLEEELRLLIGTAFQDYLADLRFIGHEQPAQFDKRQTLARLFRASIRSQGLDPRLLLKTGTSDMNVLSSRWKCPMMAYGPGDSALDHTPHEHISFREYRLAITILRDVLNALAQELK